MRYIDINYGVTLELTRFGMKEAEMGEVAELINASLKGKSVRSLSVSLLNSGMDTKTNKIDIPIEKILSNRDSPRNWRIS